MSGKPETIHRRQLFGGHATADEVWRKSLPPDAVCKCGSRKVAIRARTFMPLFDLLKDHPVLAMQIAGQNGGQVPCADMRGPGNRPVKHARLGQVFACDSCKTDLEKALAHGPSYIIVDIERGPGAERPIIQVAGGIGD